MKKNSVNRNARLRGGRAEALLLTQLIDQGLSNALSNFRASAKIMRFVPKSGTVLCYVRLNGAWNVYQWCDNTTKQVESLVAE